MQLKEQFIPGLNNEEMLVEIIREVTKCDENTNIHSENVLTWAKRVEAQRAQTAVISSLNERKCFDAIVQKDVRHTDKKPTTNTFTKWRRCKYCGQEHKLRQCLAYGKRYDKCDKLNHFKDVCRSARSSTVNTIVKEAVHKQELGIETVNINSNHSAIIANLKTSSNKAAIMVPYHSDRNIMPINIFTKLFPSTTMDHLVATKDATRLRIYNCTTITQLGICKLKIMTNAKMHFLCSSRKWRSIIRHARHWIVKHIRYKYNSVGTDNEENGVNCNMRKIVSSVQEMSNAVQTQAQKGVVPRQMATPSCYTNSGSYSNLNRLDDVLWPAVNSNEIECSFPDQTKRQTQTTMAIQISTIDQITPTYWTIMKLNISFQAQAKGVTKKQALK